MFLGLIIAIHIHTWIGLAYDLIWHKVYAHKYQTIRGKNVHKRENRRKNKRILKYYTMGNQIKKKKTTF